PNSKSIIKVDGAKTPYKDSNRLATMSKILPMGSVIKAHPDYSTADYYQYLIFVRNSDWAQPL
ncbi:MAG: hypothetical protein HRT61_20305, partial [Ekhidna sp.]|nr:hypothetical protein [Ekhidna sp.]